MSIRIVLMLFLGALFAPSDAAITAWRSSLFSRTTRS